MKKIYIILLSLFAFTNIQSQSDNCATAVSLTIGNCVTGSPGSSQSLAGCVGNADDDAWYKFTATQTSHLITVTGSSGYDAVIQLLSGPCSGLSSLGCVDNSLSGQAETINATGLTIGTTYYLRIYDYYTGTSAGTFTTCVTLPPTPPGNNNCSGARVLTVNASCVGTSTTSYGATQSTTPGCAGTADDDVWFMFTANNYTQTIQVAGSSSMDAVVELFSGTCSSLSSITCQDNTFSGGTETINATGLTPGVTYYVRVYDYYSTGGYPFSICVTGAPIPSGTQPNDEPCNAVLIPPVTANCNYLTFSNVGATNSTATPPTGCTGGTGGFTTGSKDVWFKITVPASGNLCITPQPNLTPPASVIDDAGMALYSGTCGSLTQIACSDDADGTSGASYNYPGTANDFLPYINQSGLTPGSTVYLRYWGWGSEVGTFGLCVQAPTNDLCVNALYICDLNGYSASTSPAFTPDRPGTGTGKMYGNNETSAGVNQPDGTNTGGPFGYYPPSNVAGPYSSPAIDVNIENNSWIRFTAGKTVANLRVTVGTCWVGGYPSGGIQMQVFSGTGCNNFVPVSSFKEGSNTFTVTASGLTIGNDYYLMVDGYANDICNYTINVLDGVALPEITAVPDSVCPGQSSLLTAPLGATGYTWYPTGPPAVTTRTLLVTPGTTMTYTCVAGGVCGQKQTLTKTVYVKSLPTIAINSGAPITTCGTQAITLTGSGASTYTWSTGNTTPSFTTAPVSSTSYTLIGKAANGCTTTAVANVTVNPLPNILIAGTNTICTGKSTVLTASGGTSYTWSPGSTVAASITVSPTSNTTYSVTGSSALGCTKTTTVQVQVRALPALSSTPNSNPSACGGSTGSITNVTISGAPAFTYTWTNGSSATVGSGATISGQPAGTYNLQVKDGNGCINNFGPYNISNPGGPPAPTANATANSICAGQTINLNASSTFTSPTYNWSGPNGFSSTSQNPSITNATPIMSGVYAVYVTSTAGCSGPATNVSVTVNPLPTPNATTSQTLYCAGSTITLFSSAATSYTWSGPGSFVSNLQNPAITNSSVGSAGIYTLQVIGTGGCSATTTIAVAVSPLPTVISTTSDSTCSGQPLNLSANFGSNVTVNWYSDAALTTLVQANSSTYQPNPSANGTYTYYVQASVGNCKSATSIVTGQFYNVQAVATADVYTGDAPLSVNFTGSNSTGVNASDNFSWTFGDNTNSTVIDPNHVFTGEGTYTVVLSITDIESGCMDTATVIIKTEDDLTVIVPNVFTPNGDGANDLFHIKIKGAKTAEGYIYNRWGQLLHSWDALNTSWDGTVNGQKCPDATYYYLIKVVDKKDKEHLFPGFALIAR